MAGEDMMPEPASRPLQKWEEKLAFLQEQEAVVSDPSQKFTLKEQIAEARQKIQQGGGVPPRRM